MAGTCGRNLPRDGSSLKCYSAIAGPLVHDPPVTFKYIALPITHKILMLVWLIPNGLHNSFVYNFNDHESSVVTYDLAGDPSLGSVFIVKAGTHPIP